MVKGQQGTIVTQLGIQHPQWSKNVAIKLFAIPSLNRNRRRFIDNYRQILQLLLTNSIISYLVANGQQPQQEMLRRWINRCVCTSLQTRAQREDEMKELANNFGVEGSILGLLQEKRSEYGWCWNGTVFLDLSIIIGSGKWSGSENCSIYRLINRGSCVMHLNDHALKMCKERGRIKEKGHERIKRHDS